MVHVTPLAEMEALANTPLGPCPFCGEDTGGCEVLDFETKDTPAQGSTKLAVSCGICMCWGPVVDEGIDGEDAPLPVSLRAAAVALWNGRKTLGPPGRLPMDRPRDERDPPRLSDDAIVEQLVLCLALCTSCAPDPDTTPDELEPLDTVIRSLRPDVAEEVGDRGPVEAYKRLYDEGAERWLTPPKRPR